MNFGWIKKIWDILNYISPSNRNLIIILLMGYIFYSQITSTVKSFVVEKIEQMISQEKHAEQYTKDTALEINQQVKLISDKDQEAFNVLLLSYHNNTQSLQGYKYLYLSCLMEAPKSIDSPLLKSQWNHLDYIYYADELVKLHNQSFVQFTDLDEMKEQLPKIHVLVKNSEAKAASFFVIEGKNDPLGMIVILYKNPIKYTLDYPKVILPSIQKLAILLDYENANKK